MKTNKQAKAQFKSLKKNINEKSRRYNHVWMNQWNLNCKNDHTKNNKYAQWNLNQQPCNSLHTQ